MASKAHNDRPLRVYDIPPGERAYWDSLDNRVTCDGCRNRSDVWCQVARGRTIRPPMLRHRCEDHRR